MTRAPLLSFALALAFCTPSRAERGLEKFKVMADDAAPIHFARAGTPPFLVLYGDHDMAARAEENAYFVSVLKAAGNTRIVGQSMLDRTHGSIASRIINADDPARTAILTFIAQNGGKR